MPSPNRLILIPIAMTTLRLAMAPVMVINAFTARSSTLFISCMVIAFLTDVFDGILARRLKVATPAIRKFDTATDIVFYISVICAAWIVYPQVIRRHQIGIAVLLLLEATCYIVSLVRFRQPPATHTYAAKLWGILLFITFVALFGFGYSNGIFPLTIAWGCLADTEILAILLLCDHPPVDVPTLILKI